MPDYPAGWYPDYVQPQQQRYYDGAQWTEYVHVPGASAEGSRRQRRRASKFRPSAQLVEVAYGMLFADRAMILLLLAGSVLAALAAGAILVPAMYWGHIAPTWSSGGILGVLVAGAAYAVAGFVLQLVCGAVVAAALLRAEGRPATVREALGAAWERRRQLLAWALVSALVGAAVRMLERIGLGGALAALTLNLGWAFATVFATPVIIAEGTMPAATLRRSAGLVRRQFTVTLVSNVTLAVVWTMLGFTAISVAGVGALIVAFGSGVAWTALGVVLVAAGGVGFVYVVAVSSALSSYLEALLYRYAVGLTVPGVDRHWLPPLRPAP